MTRKQVYRYKCDYCKKAGCNGGHIARHERKCTANPNRICGMCALVGEQQKTMAELFVPIATAISYFEPTSVEPDEIDVSALRELTKNCPACILAALRQFRHHNNAKITACSTDFDFKQECGVWLNQYRLSCSDVNPDGSENPHSKFDRGEWLATWRTHLPVEAKLRVNLSWVDDPAKEPNTFA